MVKIHVLCPRIATGGDEGKNRGQGGVRPPEDHSWNQSKNKKNIEYIDRQT